VNINERSRSPTPRGASSGKRLCNDKALRAKLRKEDKIRIQQAENAWQERKVLQNKSPKVAENRRAVREWEEREKKDAKGGKKIALNWPRSGH
jgi:hypothetical protein